MMRRLLCLAMAWWMLCTPLGQATDITGGGGPGPGPATLIVNVTNFGAKCDASTDDAAAFNAAWAAVRTAITTNINQAVIFQLPLTLPGTPIKRCRVASSINATGIYSSVGNVLQVKFDGQGTQIYSSVSGAPVIDALGSNQIFWDRLHILTDGTNCATYGIQIGRINTTGSDYGGGAGMKFQYPEIVGCYSNAPYYNFAGEEVHIVDPAFVNTSNAATAHGYIDDGFNHWNITSAFVTQTAPTDTAQSFEETTITGGSIQNDGTSATSGVWIGGAHQHYLDNVYVYNGSSGTTCIELYNESSGNYGGTKDERLNVHCEGSALTTDVLIDGTLTAPVIRDLWLHEDYEFASTALFALGGSATTAVLEHPTVSISGGPTSPTVVFASNPNVFFIKGADFYFYNASLWNVSGSNSGPSTFGGHATVPGNGQGLLAGPAVCASPGPITTSGLANSRNWLSVAACTYVLYGETTGSGILQLTSDGTGSSNANNCVNLPTPIGSLAVVHIDVVARDRSTTANYVAWTGYNGIYGSPSNASTTFATMGSVPTPVSAGTVTGTNIAATPDLTNGCLLLKWNPPNSNTDLWDVVASVTLTQVR
jgi:hypothetical protein